MNLRETAEVMDRNAIKRQTADPWTMDATTIHAPGEESVLEDSIAAIDEGDESILFDYLAADDHWDLDDEAQWLAAVEQASGDAWGWTNIAGMRSLFLSPKKSRAQFRRYQLNQGVAVENKPFSGEKFDRFEDRKRTPNPDDDVPMVLFLDGSLTRDATALIGWTLDERPHLFLAGLWERPDASLREEWRVPKREVVDLVEELMSHPARILGGDADRYWSPQLTAWEEVYGDKRVVHFGTRYGRLMGTAIDRFEEDWRAGLAADGLPTPWTHDGSPQVRRHFASTVVGRRNNSRYKILQKATEGMGDKIDIAVAAVSGYAMLPAARLLVGELRPVKSGIY